MRYTPDPARDWIVAPAYSEPRLIETLAAIMADADAPGFSDVGIRNWLYTEILNTRPRRVLEVGTHLGSGAVVMGTALQRNGFGHLLTLEPQDVFQTAAQRYIDMAGVSDVVDILPGFSFDPPIRARLEAEAPFDLIFIDGAHEFEAARFDIELCYSLLSENGLIILHDTGVRSPSMDQSGRGGVRRAVDEFVAATPGARAIFREYPLWPNDCGAAMICKQKLDPPVQRD